MKGYMQYPLLLNNKPPSEYSIQILSARKIEVYWCAVLGVGITIFVPTRNCRKISRYQVLSMVGA